MCAGRPGLTRVLPARLTNDLARPEVRLVGWQGSGDLAANARANCYAVLPDGERFEDGRCDYGAAAVGLLGCGRLRDGQVDRITMRQGRRTWWM